LLQPYVVVKAWERPSEGGLAGALGCAPTPIGESLQSLTPVLPCCWLEGVTTDRSYLDQKPLISEKLRRSREEGRVREHFRQLTDDELRLQRAHLKEGVLRLSLLIQIITVRGLGDMLGSEKIKPRCTCEIYEKPTSRISTPSLSDTSAAVWNYEAKITDCIVGDSLLFCLMDSEEVDMKDALGRVLLPSDQFYPGGFEGDLLLSMAAEGEVHLQVKVTVAVEGQKKQKALITREKEKDDFLDSEALPAPLRKSREQRRELQLTPIDLVNVETEETFTPRKGDEIKVVGAEHARRFLPGKLENSTSRPFVHDFWYKGMPLLRNHDIPGTNDASVDWSFQPAQTFGFVKCTFKLTDGWDGTDHGECEDKARNADFEQQDDEEREEADEVKLRRSFEFDQHLNSYAFDERALLRKFKSPRNVPSRVRVRIYFVKAVCVYGKAGAFADPYIEFQLGRSINVSMKNMVKPSTNTPDFYHVEERDVQLPYDGRLEVSIMDMEEMSIRGDVLIGSTVIDLEDRWHSRTWRKYNEMQIVPLENRSLFTSDVPGKNRGSLEMWIEMVETTKVSDFKPSDIRKPPELDIEVRFVIWGATAVPIVKDDYTNVKISTMLDCKEYNGEHAKTQETDVHFACRDGRAVFAWRVVYPNIRMPVFSCGVQFSLYHSELVLGDTFLGSLNLDLKGYVEKVSRDMVARELGPTDLRFEAADSSSAEGEGAGAVSVSLYVMTQMEANTRKQGTGREDPNDNPQLITPTEGREWAAYLSTFGFAWPDFSLWKKLLPLAVALFAFLISVIAFKNMGLL